MSTFGTPEGNGRATQPPLDGPSLATPHRSPFPTSLRPSLFHARSTPLSATYSPVSSTATPVTLAAAAHLQAPRNTPSSAFSSRTTSAPAKNPFERLPASSFDSFVSSVTRRIKSALEPGELPSERRRREREEREKERERARREREEARRRKQEEDVFGDIRALGEEMRGEEAAAGDLSEEQFDSTDLCVVPQVARRSLSQAVLFSQRGSLTPPRTGSCFGPLPPTTFAFVRRLRPHAFRHLPSLHLSLRCPLSRSSRRRRGRSRPLLLSRILHTRYAAA